MIGEALAEFQLFLTFANAPIDKYALGNLEALSEDQKRGALVFFDESKGKCIACHAVSGSSNEMFSDFKMHNAGIPQLTPKFGMTTGNVGFGTLSATLCRNGVLDLGRFEFDGKDSSRFLFRTSPLRNISLQPFFFHNGSFNNLKEAVSYHLNPKENIKTYDPKKTGVPSDLYFHPEVNQLIFSTLDPTFDKPIMLTEQEINDLITFLAVGLLDVEAKPENLKKLIPDNLPSGQTVAKFQ